MKIYMKLFYQYMAIFLNFSPTSNHLQPLQVKNCGSNSRLVVVEDDNGKLRPERVKQNAGINKYDQYTHIYVLVLKIWKLYHEISVNSPSNLKMSLVMRIYNYRTTRYIH